MKGRGLSRRTRQESALARRVAEFDRWEKLKVNDNGTESKERKLSIAARDIYQTATNLGVQDKYTKYMKYIKKPAVKPSEQAHDMTPLDVIEAMEDMLREMINNDQI